LGRELVVEKRGGPGWETTLKVEAKTYTSPVVKDASTLVLATIKLRDPGALA
jgi:hypothetical protein